MDNKTTIHELKEAVRKYCEARDWDQFHGAKDMAVALSIEASELLEHFRFKNKEEVEEHFTKKRDEIGEEVADVLFFILRFSQRYNIDISTIFNRKMELNEKKYPVEKAKGSNKKYNEL